MLGRFRQIADWGHPLRSRSEQAVTGGYIAAFVAAVLALWVAGERAAQSYIFNSDSLWMEDYLRDLFVRGVDVRTWNMPGAPNFFPEMLLYGIARYATGSVYWGFVGFGLAKLAIYLATGFAVLSSTTDLPSRQKVRILMLVAAVLLLGTIFLDSVFNAVRFPDFWQLWVPTAHGGAVANTLIAICLMLAWLRDPGKQWLHLALLLGLCVLASLSDRLYTVWFTVPAVVALSVLVLLKRLPWKQVLLPVAGLVLSDFVARRIFVWISPLQIVPYLLSPSTGWISVVAFYTKLFREGWYQPLVVVSYVALVVVATLMCVRAVRAGLDADAASLVEEKETRRLFLFILAVLIWPISFAAMVLINRPETQYLAAGDLAALSVWPCLLLMTRWGRRFWAGLGAHLALLIGVGAYLTSLAVLVPMPLLAILTPPTPHDGLVACLDDHAADLGGGAGLADYWQARRINLFSEKGLRVDQAQGPFLMVFQWASDREMFQTRKHTFVITDTPTNLPKMLEADVVRYYGLPDARFMCSGFPVLVYYAGLDSKIGLPRVQVQENLSSASTRSPLRLDQDRLFTLVGQAHDGDVASTGAAGWLLFGPYVTLDPGTYRISWSGAVEAPYPSSIGLIDVASAAGGAEISKAAVTRESLAAMPPGQIASLDFSLERRTPLIEFRFYVSANAIVSIDQVVLTPLP